MLHCIYWIAYLFTNIILYQKQKKIMRKLTIIISQSISHLSKPRKQVKLQKHPLICKIDAVSQYTRALTLTLPHGNIETPVYMPVGTKGTMKGITSKQMEELGCWILLANTYHLAYKPGGEFLEQVGGLHRFMNWNRNILTDSGGFQMVSLSKLCEITQQGVTFQNPYDKSIMKIRPQDSIAIQNKIGSDIMMALDDVVKTTTVGPRMQQAMQRTLRWIDRNIEANKNPDRQNLFPIVQGGIDFQLRKRCLQGLMNKEVNGFAIGGLAGGEAKKDFFKIVRFNCEYLPEDKPRYLMGVGYPVDIALCAALGVDMFDCVFPTRTARFGTAFTSYGQIKLRNKAFAKDFRPLQQGCTCQACTHYTRAYLHLIQKEDVFCHLLSMHNIKFNFTVMQKVRQATKQNKLAQFYYKFINDIYRNDGKIPNWVQVALQEAKIEIKFQYPLYEEPVKKQKNQVDQLRDNLQANEPNIMQEGQKKQQKQQEKKQDKQ